MDATYQARTGRCHDAAISPPTRRPVVDAPAQHSPPAVAAAGLSARAAIVRNSRWPTGTRLRRARAARRLRSASTCTSRVLATTSTQSSGCDRTAHGVRRRSRRAFATARYLYIASAQPPRWYCRRRGHRQARGGSYQQHWRRCCGELRAWCLCAARRDCSRPRLRRRWCRWCGRCRRSATYRWCRWPISGFVSKVWATVRVEGHLSHGRMRHSRPSPTRLGNVPTMR